MCEEERDGYCVTNRGARRDRYLRAWVNDIPHSHVGRAVWEYKRYQDEFSPYTWDGLKLSPNLPSELIPSIFKCIKDNNIQHARKIGRFWVPGFFVVSQFLLIAFIFIRGGDVDLDTHSPPTPIPCNTQWMSLTRIPS